MNSSRPLNILLLCDYRDDIAATVRDHITSLERLSRHRWMRLSMLGDISADLDLDRFDVVIVHYTLVACMPSYLSVLARSRLAQFAGVKAIFIQDEYRFVDASIAAMREIGIDVLFTCVPNDEIENVYPERSLPGVRKVSVLTGYVPIGLADRKVVPTFDRPIDIGYRGRDVPAWLGQLGQEKRDIGIRVRDDAPKWGLVTDISFREEDRLYGDRWTKFVMRCKAMLGVESGASVIDFSGAVQRQVERHAARSPNTTFKELQELYFAELEGRININQISPRSFEAAALRTLMILYEGEYSGILQANRHYVPLKKDHSNMAEVVAILRDRRRVEEIVECAYQEVALDPRWSFASFVSEVDNSIDAAIASRGMRAVAAYTVDEFAAKAAPDFNTVRRRAFRKVISWVYVFVFRTVLGGLAPAKRERAHRRLRQVYNFVTGYRFRRPQL